jgi:hypothetical protein
MLELGQTLQLTSHCKREVAKVPAKGLHGF